MESEQATPVVSIKDVVRSSVNVPEFDKHLKKAGGHIGQNIVEITIKMKTIVYSFGAVREVLPQDWNPQDQAQFCYILSQDKIIAE